MAEFGANLAAEVATVIGAYAPIVAMTTLLSLSATALTLHMACSCIGVRVYLVCRGLLLEGKLGAEEEHI